MDLTGTPFAKWTEKDWTELGIEAQNWTLSQFMHGEQGALLAAAQLVDSVPGSIRSSTRRSQVADEARHVEVFYNRYLHTKMSGFSIRSTRT